MERINGISPAMAGEGVGGVFLANLRGADGIGGACVSVWCTGVFMFLGRRGVGMGLAAGAITTSAASATRGCWLLLLRLFLLGLGSFKVLVVGGKGGKLRRTGFNTSRCGLGGGDTACTKCNMSLTRDGLSSVASLSHGLKVGIGASTNRSGAIRFGGWGIVDVDGWGGLGLLVGSVLVCTCVRVLLVVLDRGPKNACTRLFLAFLNSGQPP